MRIGTAAALAAALASAGCGSVSLPGLPFAEQPAVQPQPQSLGPDPNARAFDSPVVEKPRRKAARKPPPPDDAGQQPAAAGASKNEFLSPGWAKQEKIEQEDWEKDLDRKINSICRGC